jgi:multiple sugar transport system ATP-binding protein
MADITLTRIDKLYDNGFHAVKAVDLHIADHEFMVLVGPSGCGKTTTLRMIAGLEEISGGEIRIGSRVVNQVEPKDRDIAFVFQNYALYPHMTVRENMAYALSLRKLPKTEIAQKVDEAARLLGLQEQLEKLPKQLSGGQRQRVALGRAIVRHPQVFLFDEPLSNLDAKLRGEMRYELKTLQQRLQTTMVYVTHDQIEAMTLGDRITVMNKGVIQQVGAPTAIYDHPWNRFVAGFLGTPTMNFLSATVVGGSLRLASGATLAAPPAAAEALRSREGRGVVLGIRPEHFMARSAAAAQVEVRVDLVEAMGDHQLVYGSGLGTARPVVLRADSHLRVALGEKLPVGLDLGACHVFDGEGEDAANLCLPAGYPQIQGPAVRQAAA